MVLGEKFGLKIENLIILGVWNEKINWMVHYNLRIRDNLMRKELADTLVMLSSD